MTAFRMLVCFTGLLSACVERPPGEKEAVPTTAAVATDSATFPGRVVAELSALRQGVTPAEWLRNHPGDSLSPFTINEGNEKAGAWCIRTSRRDSLADGSAIVRNAYFYPPSLPVLLELPSDEDARDIAARTCILGVVWVETPHSESAGGRQLAERIREALTREYGKVTTADTDFFARLPITDSQKNVLRTSPRYETNRLGISFFGSAFWHAPGRWKRGSVTVVSAFDAGSRYVSVPRVLAFAHLPNAQLDRELSFDESTPELDEALIAAGRLTQLDSIVVKNFLALRGERADDSERIAALERWLATAANLKSGQRAAALFVADGVVSERLDEDDSVASHAYANLGLKFVRSELAGSNNYTHGLLEEALRLDPNGPIGQLATIELLDRGFDLTGMCGGGGFDHVIKVGEPFVSRLTTPRAKARVLFLLGDAYTDIVALAAGAGQEYVDSSDYSARAPSARRKAIGYYRQGLALDKVSQKAGEAWLEGWRLLAGLPPSRTHFFCVYD